MVTKIPQVRVSRVEGGNGFTATCTHPYCTWRAIRAVRQSADALAAEHQASHTRPDPADQVHDWAVG